MATQQNDQDRPDSCPPDVGPTGLPPDEVSVSFAAESFESTEPPRPDAAIHRDIVERIARHPKLRPRDCEILVRNGEVRLAGVVANGHARRLIEDLCLSVSGVWECDNGLRVSRSARSDGRVDPDRG